MKIIIIRVLILKMKFKIFFIFKKIFQKIFHRIVNKSFLFSVKLKIIQILLTFKQTLKFQFFKQ